VPRTRTPSPPPTGGATEARRTDRSPLVYAFQAEPVAWMSIAEWPFRQFSANTCSQREIRKDCHA
jgi:hypothetical protein